MNGPDPSYDPEGLGMGEDEGNVMLDSSWRNVAQARLLPRLVPPFRSLRRGRETKKNGTSFTKEKHNEKNDLGCSYVVGCGIRLCSDAETRGM